MPISRNLKKAREAFEKRDVAASIAAHAGVADETHQAESGQYIKSAVYGGLDGIITTFAVVAGAAGATLSSGVVLILGFANLVADGLSMAIGDYLSTKAEQDYQKAERRREEWEIENYPEGEKREMVELYVAKGMSEADAKAVVSVFASYHKAWVDAMMMEELGIVTSTESPLRNATVTFLSFGLFGLVPLLGYVAMRLMPTLPGDSFVVACISTAVTLLVLGMLKTRVTRRNWIRSGLETLAVGGIAAAAAYGIGILLRGLA